MSQSWCEKEAHVAGSEAPPIPFIGGFREATAGTRITLVRCIAWAQHLDLAFM